jgi:hypothetical protein
MTDQPDQKPPVEIDTEKIPELLSILPLFDATLFPKMVLPLVVMQGGKRALSLTTKIWPRSEPVR